jgi:thiol-disulfide isomerase/thioredoxin
MTGLWVLLGTLVVAGAAGLALRARDGRLRGAHVIENAGPTAGPIPAADDLRGELAALGATPGERATLLQFSSAFCAPCRTTRRVLADVAAVVPGVTHVEVDAESHLELVRRLGIRRTPTVLVVDAAGREVKRASGAPPRTQQVIAAIAAEA